MSDSEELGFVFIGHRTTRDLYEKHGEQTRIGLDDESSLDSSTILDILRRKKGRRIASRGQLRELCAGPLTYDTKCWVY